MNSNGYKVNITKSAKYDLFEIYKHVYFNDCEESANKLYSKLVDKIKSFRNFPNREHIPPELKFLGIEDFLEIYKKPFKIIYQIIGKEVFVHCVLEGRRDMQQLSHERLIR